MSSLDQHMEIIAGLVAGTLESSALAGLMSDGADPGPAARVYRNSSLLAACDALKSNYQATGLIMGDEFFSAMARAYVDANRAEQRSLVGYGRSLPEFIDSAAEQHGLPWLSSIAQLDRAWLEAHLAKDDKPLAPEDLAGLACDEEKLLAAQFGLRRSVCLVETAQTVFDLWQDLRAKRLPEAAVEVSSGAQHVLIWRHESEVQSRTTGPGEHAFLGALSRGKTLGNAAQSGVSAEETFDAGSALAINTSSGVLADYNSKEGRDF